MLRVCSHDLAIKDSNVLEELGKTTLLPLRKNCRLRTDELARNLTLFH